MAILLKKMTESEFNEYFKKLVVDYAKENVENGHWEEDEALELSRQQTNALLPQGLNTENHYLFSLFSDKLNMNVGYLWVQIQETKSIKKAFIFDIELIEMFRGKGLGKETLQVLEDWLKTQNVKTLALHVFDKNTVARKLYFKFGFKDMSHNMIKELN